MRVLPAMSTVSNADRALEAPVSSMRARRGGSLPRLVWSAMLSMVAFWLVVSGAEAQSASGQRMRVPAEVYAGDPVREIEARSATLLRGRFDESTSSFRLELAPLPEWERRALASANDKPGAPLQIGVERRVPPRFRGVMRSGDLEWSDTPDGGMAATFTVRSPEAVAVRLALRMADFPRSGQVRFFNVAQPGQSFGPYGRDEFRAQARAAADAGGEPGPYWSPVVGGEELGVELYVRRQAQRHRLEFSIEAVPHLLYSPKYSDPADIFTVKASQACEIDLACSPDWQSTGNAVARILFQDGGTFLCTGQLMNDTDSSTQIPYFSTATHCIGNQGAASSINFFWFDQLTSCGGGGTTTQQTSGGAALLSTSSTNGGTDFSFMQLNQPPPGGVSLAGWTSGTPGLGTSITGIHHPAGDVKKISQGTLNGFEPWSGGTNTHLLVNWSSGVTEGGSSGSALFAPNQQLIGVLTGGSSFCSAPNAPDLYGRFDLSFRAISQWLAAAAPPPPPLPPPPPPPPPGPTACNALPEAPPTLTNSVDGSTVVLNWSSPGGGVNAPTSYRLEAGTAPGLANLVDADQGNTTSVTAINVGNGIYYVRVRAVNPCGTGLASPETLVIVGGGGTGGGGACTAAPGAATSLRATISGSTMRLDWSPPVSTASFSSLTRINEPTTYIVQAGSAPGLSNLANSNLQSPIPSMIAAGVGPGTYYVRILGRNSCGTGLSSNEIVVRVN